MTFGQLQQTVVWDVIIVGIVDCVEAVLKIVDFVGCRLEKSIKKEIEKCYEIELVNSISK